MLDLSLLTGRQLAAKKVQAKNWRKVQGELFESLQVDESHKLAGYDAHIREIESELVRRAMAYEDRAVTLPRHIIEAIQSAASWGYRIFTVYELMTERNQAVERRATLATSPEWNSRAEDMFQARLRAIDDEIQTRVLEFEDLNAKTRSGLLVDIRM